MELQNWLLILLVILIFTALLLFILDRFGVAIFGFRISKIIDIFIEKKQKLRPLEIFLGDRAGFVFSSDGNQYKAHLRIALDSELGAILNSAEIELDNKHKFEFKQFFRYGALSGHMFPNPSQNLPLVTGSPIQKTCFEFQTPRHKPYNLSLGKHFIILTLIFSNKTIRKKIKFKFDSHHKKGFDSDRQSALNSKQAIVSYLPIEIVENI